MATKSKKSTIAIVGATGNIGHTLTEALLKKGHSVRAIGRSAQKLQGLKAKGAETHHGDLTDENFMAKVFKGCNAVFSFIPPGYEATDMEVFRDRTAEAIVQGITKAKVPYVVNLSAIGADNPSNTGPIHELHLQEERLDCLPNLNVLHFRASLFMENLLAYLPSAESTGKIASSLRANAPLPMVATADIAEKCAEFLNTLQFSGSTVFEFVGPKEITMTEAAKVIGKALGKPSLTYTQISYQQDEQQMVASGMKHQVAKLFVDMYKAINEGVIAPTQELTAEHKGTTTLEEFCKNTLAQAARPARKKAA